MSPLCRCCVGCCALGLNGRSRPCWSECQPCGTLEPLREPARLMETMLLGACVSLCSLLRPICTRGFVSRDRISEDRPRSRYLDGLLARHRPSTATVAPNYPVTLIALRCRVRGQNCFG